MICGGTVTLESELIAPTVPSIYLSTGVGTTMNLSPALSVHAPTMSTLNTSPVLSEKTSQQSEKLSMFNYLEE